MSMLGENLEAILRWLLSLQRTAPEPAVAIVLEAVDATAQHIANLVERGIDEDQPAPPLVEHWLRAAAAIRATDRQLARRLEMKAGYWADPRRWTQWELEDARITLRDIQVAARALPRQLEA